MDNSQTPQAKLRKVALEEHFGHAAALKHDAAGDIDFEAFGKDERVPAHLMRRIRPPLQKIGGTRIEKMDGDGVDYEILSLTDPGVQGMNDAAEAASAAREINDFLACEISKISQPSRRIRNRCSARCKQCRQGTRAPTEKDKEKGKQPRSPSSPTGEPPRKAK